MTRWHRHKCSYGYVSGSSRLELVHCWSTKSSSAKINLETSASPVTVFSAGSETSYSLKRRNPKQQRITIFEESVAAFLWKWFLKDCDPIYSYFASLGYQLFREWYISLGEWNFSLNSREVKSIKLKVKVRFANAKAFWFQTETSLGLFKSRLKTGNVDF
jgi:hypothetical protein